MQELKQKILEYIQENGPVLPIQISKEIQGNTIFAGAFLSELVSSQKVKMSHAKIGGSRLYYVPGQEEKLQVLASHLSERPKKAFELLKEKKILRDKDCEPWERVALREIKDFSVPLQVNIKGNIEIFWKWYLLSDEETEKLILELIKNEIGNETIENKEVSKTVESKDEFNEKIESKEEVSKTIESKDEDNETIEESNNEVIESKDEVSETIENKEDIKENLSANESQEKLPFEHLNAGEFYENIVKFLQSNNVSIVDQKVITKNRELNFIIEIPSNLGNLKYFVIARNKKKLNDADLSLAFHQGSELKLPVMVISPGTITKKAEKFINEKLKGLVFKQI
ncbi:hypothetical protein D6777_00770 [Candidatus Woesearchaeota archaeon]|nr:MAG: hypothetical protein D6777_00770 [Candidatus Woesearchaeota archaeon]